MKAIGLVGSPRKGGNVDILLQKALEGARDKGAETTLFYLNDMHIRGCQACFACKKTGKCVVKDDMQAIYQAIDEADGVIMGSPVYFGRISAQLAPVLDRLYAYLMPDSSSTLAQGKKCGLVFTQGQPNSALYLPSFESLAQVMGRLGFEPGSSSALIGAGLRELGAAAQNEQYLQQAYAMGGQLVAR